MYASIGGSGNVGCRSWVGPRSWVPMGTISYEKNIPGTAGWSCMHNISWKFPIWTTRVQFVLQPLLWLPNFIVFFLGLSLIGKLFFFTANSRFPLVRSSQGRMGRTPCIHPLRPCEGTKLGIRGKKYFKKKTIKNNKMKTKQKNILGWALG